MVTTNLLFKISIRPRTDEDIPWLRQHLIDEWGGEPALTHTGSHYPTQLPGFVAILQDAEGEEIIGEVTYAIENSACEIITLSSLREGLGIGTALFMDVENAARAEGCRKLHLITTTDNLHAIGFYQKRGMRIAEVIPDMMNDVRKVKPQLVQIGMNGIPLQDAILLEKELI